MTDPLNAKRKVLLVGWDAGDWKVIHPLMDSGLMPNVQRLVETGTMANLATLHPVLSPMLWTSISTGKRPFKHGIHGFSEPTPDGSHIRPITTLSRKTKAIWNILSQNGIRSNVVGWWPSNPAEPILGTMVSNLFQQAIGALDRPWPVRPGSVHPPELTEALAELRLNPNELSIEHLLPFIPDARDIDQDNDTRLASCAKILAECTSVHAVATFLMQNEPWDFMAVYYDAIDHFCHGFMKYHPPKQEHISQADFERYQHVVNAGYIYHDMMLGTLLDLAGDNTTVILMSDHGFHPDHLRPKSIPLEPAGPAVEHRDLGILVINGPGIRQDALVAGPNLLDIAPTILSLFDLPVGEDIDGSPIVDAFQDPPDIETIPSWDEVAGKAGTHPDDLELDSQESQEALNQLVALGYIEPLDENKEKAIANTTRELQYNLALSYIDDSQHAAAAEILEDLYQQWPNEHRFGVRLANVYLALGQTEELRSVVEDLSTRRKVDAEMARDELQEFRRRIRQRLDEQASQAESPSDDAKLAATNDADASDLAADDSATGDSATALDSATGDSPSLDSDNFKLKPGEELTDQERSTLRTLRAHAQYNPYWIDYLWGNVLFAEGDYQKAIQRFQNAEQAAPQRLGLHLQLGTTYLKTREVNRAAACFQKALDRDAHNPKAVLGLARCELRRRNPRRAVQLARESIGLQYSDAFAHFVLGIGLHRTRQVESAIDAFKTAISLNPNFPQAHRRLGLIYRREFHDTVQANYHARVARELRNEIRKHRQTVNDRPHAEQEFKRESLLPPVEAASNLDRKKHVSNATQVEKADQLITVVTGLPRSGTSVMMQMLDAAGVEPLTDHLRIADEDNPLGYFEFEGAKRLQTDRSWLPDAVQKSVKIVAQLLPYLPKTFRYRVIMVNRDLDEVLMSQQKMLERNGKEGAQLSPDALKNVFTKQLNRVRAWLERTDEVDWIEVEHRDIMDDPNAAAQKIQEFLHVDTPIEKIAQIVQTQLYRQRSERSSSQPL